MSEHLIKKRSELNESEEFVLQAVEIFDDIIHEVTHGGPGADYGLSAMLEEEIEKKYEKMLEYLYRIGFNVMENK